MHRFGPEPKRTTDSGKKRNERTQSTFLDPIVMFWFVLVSFVTAQKTMPKLHLTLRFGPEETNYRFGPETKRTHPIHFFGPTSDVLVRFGQFCYCAKKPAKVAFMHRFGPEPKRTTDSVKKRNER